MSSTPSSRSFSFWGFYKFMSWLTAFQSILTGGARLSFVAPHGGGRRQLSIMTVPRAAATEEEVEVLQKDIAELYDQSSALSESAYGELTNQGFYDPGSTVSFSDYYSAQIRMLEETLTFAFNSEKPTEIPKKILDVGCAIGGTLRYLATKFGAQCQGIDLSPVEVQRAEVFTAARGLSDKVSFKVANALNQPFPNGEFDLVWSMMCGEHMPDKRKFVSELVRVAAPGATIVIVTLCHRVLSPSEESLRPDEKELLNKICNAYYLPAWCSTSDYVNFLEAHSLQDIRTADWTENVAPLYLAVMNKGRTWKFAISLLRCGWKTIRGTVVVPLMIEGFKKDLIKFSIITCRKPA